MYYYKNNLNKSVFKKNKIKKPNIVKKNSKYKRLKFEIVVLISLMIWLIFFSKIFTIDKISISGLNKISDKDIREKIYHQFKQKKYFLVKQNNILFLDKKNLSNNILKDIRIKKIEINKKLFHDLIISITEKQYAFIWQEDDIRYYLCEKGFILSEIKNEVKDDKKYPIIYNLSKYKINNSQITVNLVYLEFIDNIFKELSIYKNDFNIKNFTIDQEFYTIKVSLDSDIVILFNIRENILRQINKLLVFKKQEKNNFYKKKYIDVRYNNSVYSK